MAEFSAKGVGQLSAKLESLANADELAKKMLTEAAPILYDELYKQASPHRVTGDMVESIKIGKIKKKADEYSISVTPTGDDRKGVSNMDKMMWLEYGVKGRPATPIMATAVGNAESACVEKMQEVFTKEVHG